MEASHSYRRRSVVTAATGDPLDAWRHRVVEGEGSTVLLLHGTGGDENSLIDLARELAPSARLVGVAGRSTEEGVRRYFRRFSALEYDQEHLASEADALADFVGAAALQHAWGDDPVIALGYSNGANIAVAMLLRHPGLLKGAALLRPVQPLTSPPEADLRGTAVLTLSGERDPYSVAAAPLADLLRKRGATVEAHAVAAGHEIVRDDLRLLARWLAGALWRPA